MEKEMQGTVHPIIIIIYLHKCYSRTVCLCLRNTKLDISQNVSTVVVHIMKDNGIQNNLFFRCIPRLDPTDRYCMNKKNTTGCQFLKTCIFINLNRNSLILILSLYWFQGFRPWDRVGHADHYFCVRGSCHGHGSPDWDSLWFMVPELWPGLRHHLPPTPLRSFHPWHEHLRLSGWIHLWIDPTSWWRRTISQTASIHLLPWMDHWGEGPSCD